MSIGQAYIDVLTPHEQQALQAACDRVIDECFEDLQMIHTSDDITHTIFDFYLPKRYAHRYTPLFLKQFTVCIITVAWKLAQPEPCSLSSIAEELAARTLIEQAREVLEEEEGQRDEQAFVEFINTFFEDTDFEFLFEDAYDGIDETEVGKHLGMVSLAFKDWFVPFFDKASRIAHPYLQ